MKRGKLVVFGGMDASGKATQSDCLASQIGADLFSFPNYESITGRALGLHATARWRAEGMGPAEFDGVHTNALLRQALMTINRYEQAQEIEAQLAAGRHVVCDRYYESGVVYGEADGLPFDWLWKVHSALPQPDLSLLLDITPEESVRRRPERRDDYEKRAGFMGKVRTGYLRLFERCAVTGPGAWCIVDGMGPLDGVSKRINVLVRQLGDI